MPHIPIVLPRWTTIAVFGLVSVLYACGDSGTGPPDPPDDEAEAFIVQSLTLGTEHTCGLTAEGVAYCWGGNQSGQLGDGTNFDRTSPVAVVGNHAFTTLAAGGSYTCGISTDDAIYCWGRNHLGQLGNGTTTDSPAPVRVVAGAPELVSLALSGGYSCGLTPAGVAYCWGSNVHGQFGNEKEVVDGACTLHEASRPPDKIDPYCPSPVPAAVGLTLRALGPGAWHACGLTLDGKAYCWGRNAAGQIGDNTTIDRLTPVPISSDLRFGELSAGRLAYACGLTNEGGAYCWGALPYGYLDEQSTRENELLGLPRTPAAVAPDLEFQSVSVGFDVACGLTDDGAAHCWGDNLHGQLGDGTTRDLINGMPRMTPRPVLGGRTFQTLVAGGSRACGLTTTGAAYCWGRNAYGELGDGTTTNRSEPVLVLAP